MEPNNDTSIEEQRELLNILKFTPRTYTVEMSGYGLEIAVGTVSRETYDYFIENEIDIDEVATNDYNESGIPDELMPFPPGEWYECGDIYYGSGITVDDSGIIIVYDENHDKIWSCSLDTDLLFDEGIEAEEMDEIYIGDQALGTVVFYGAYSEKGMLFEGPIILKTPFDPKKLLFQYDDVQGNKVLASLLYDDEYIENQGSSSSGKGGDFSLVLIE